MLSGAQNGTELAANITEQAFTAAQSSSSWFGGPIGWATSSLSSAFSWAKSCAYNVVTTPINFLGFMTLKRSTTTTRASSGGMGGTIRFLSSHFTGMVYDKILTPPLMALKYIAGPIHKGTSEELCRKFFAEKNAAQTPLRNALIEFAAWAYNLRNTLDLKAVDVIFLESTLKNIETLEDLDNVLRLVELYQRFDKKVSGHRAKLSTLQSAADFTYLNHFSTIISSPYKVPMTQGYSNAYQAFTCYYNGKKSEGREYLYNCIKDVGLATILTLLADTTLPSMEGTYAGYAISALKISIGIAISAKLHNKVFNAKSQLFLRRRHQLIDQYIDAIAHGRTEEVAEVLRQLIEDYQVDPDDIKLMSQVQEQNALEIKTQLQRSLLKGLEVLIKNMIENPHAQSSRAGIVSYAHKLKTVCNLDPSNTQAMHAYRQSMPLDEATDSAVNTIIIFNRLDEIKEALDRMIQQQPLRAQKDIELLLAQLKLVDPQTHAKYLKAYQTAQFEAQEKEQALNEQRQIELERQITQLLPNAIGNQDKITQLLSSLKAINEKAFTYFQSLAIEAVEKQIAHISTVSVNASDMLSFEKNLKQNTLETDLLALAPTTEALIPGFQQHQEGLRQRQSSKGEKKKTKTVHSVAFH